MEEFLLDILGWERSEADWLFKLFHKFGAIGDSFCVMCDSAGMDAYECVCSDRVEPEALETVFLQNLFASNLDNTDFILPNNITCVKDVILKTDHGKLTEEIYDDDYCSLSYEDLTKAHKLILELEEFYNSYHCSKDSLKNSSEKQKEIVNIPAGFTLEEFVFKNVYGHKTRRR